MSRLASSKPMHFKWPRRQDGECEGGVSAVRVTIQDVSTVFKARKTEQNIPKPDT